MENLTTFLESLSPAELAELRRLLPQEGQKQKKLSPDRREIFKIAPQCCEDGSPLIDTGYAPDLRMRFDYYSAVWEQCTLLEVLTHYGLQNYFEQVIKSEAFRSLFKTDDLIRIPFNNIILSIPHTYINQTALFGQASADLLDGIDFMTLKLSRVLLNISGQGLEWMRQNGHNPEHILRIPPLPHEHFHVTRVDYAFDFKNFKFDFFTDCIDFLSDADNLTNAGRLMINGATTPITFRLTRGASEVIYLGATASERMLRMYDKKLEQSTLVSGVHVFESDFWGDPAKVFSWLRIEWQTRNKQAQELLYNDSETYWLYILKEIHNFYSFLDLSQKVRGDVKNCPAVDFWRDFWNFEIINQKYSDIVGQNGHFVQLGISLSPAEAWEKNIRYVEQRSWKQILCYAYQLRTKEWLACAKPFYLDIVTPLADKEAERVRKKRYMAFLCKLSEVFGGLIDDFLDSNGILMYPSGDNITMLNAQGEIVEVE